MIAVGQGRGSSHLGMDSTILLAEQLFDELALGGFQSLAGRRLSVLRLLLFQVRGFWVLSRHDDYLGSLILLLAYQH